MTNDPKRPNRASASPGQTPAGWYPEGGVRGESHPLDMARIPTATYRVQLNAAFGFRQAAELVPYLHRLGISDLYTSPYLKARGGSTHGYDVADPNALNPELGSEEDYARLVGALQDHDMGQLVDVVPNHMGISDPGNTRWMDVLENGPSSVYASFFDIDWNPPKPNGEDQNKVILPVLGDQYGRVLENGELSVAYTGGGFTVQYHEHRYPVAPDSYWRVLEPCRQQLERQLGPSNEQMQELASIITALRHLPARDDLDDEARQERNREKTIVKRRIAALHDASPPFRKSLESELAAINGRPGDADSFDHLDALLAEQSYRLAFWRVASEEINYRRFFDIAEMAAVRMEDPQVFEETHSLLLRLVGEGAVTGLRIDHPDGLLDPARYFQRLQERAFLVRQDFLRAHPQTPSRGRGMVSSSGGKAPSPPWATDEDAWERERRRDRQSPLPLPLYVVAEKILSPGERLPTGWPIHGTTGYDFLNALNGIFVDGSSRRAFDALYGWFARTGSNYRDLSNSTKKMLMLIYLASEINQLAYALHRIARNDRRYRDFTLNSLTFTIREVLAALRVYRTYVDPETGRASLADTAQFEAAVAEARRRNPRTDPSVFRFIRACLLEPAADVSEQQRADRLRFVAKLQQASGPVMAKGVEDTAFYVYNRLISLNEVGGDPDRFGIPVSAFHQYNQTRLRHWPAGLNCTSTHDTKRSEDVRARINVLSEMPREWRAALGRWSHWNASHKSVVEGRHVPDRNEEYLLYQTLVGAWPNGSSTDHNQRDGTRSSADSFVERIAGFMLKAVREAKVNTSWISPNLAYEQAVEFFVRGILDGGRSGAFLNDLRDFAGRVGHFGYLNSLSQVLLKIASPGVPDIYQGNELWDFSLVDPDNRRPVDYALRMRALASISAPGGATPPQTMPNVMARATPIDDLEDASRLVASMLGDLSDGRLKLYLSQRLLSLRRQNPALFLQGGYVPLRGRGISRQHVCAFARVHGDAVAVAVAPVLVLGLMRGVQTLPVGEDCWHDTFLDVGQVVGEPGRCFRNVLTGEPARVEEIDGHPALRLSDVLRTCPVALLSS